MSIELDPEDFETLGPDATADLEKALSDVLGDRDDNPLGDLDPDSIVTRDDLESELEGIGGVTEDDAAEIAQQYSLGGLHHIIEGDCEHEEHQRIRERLGLEDDEDGQDAGGDDGEDEPEGDSSSEGSGGDTGESEASQDNGGSDEPESPWGQH